MGNAIMINPLGGGGDIQGLTTYEITPSETTTEIIIPNAHLGATNLMIGFTKDAIIGQTHPSSDQYITDFYFYGGNGATFQVRTITGGGTTDYWSGRFNAVNTDGGVRIYRNTSAVPIAFYSGFRYIFAVGTVFE